MSTRKLSVLIVLTALALGAAGYLSAAGLSNEELASTLRRVPFPFRGELEVTGLEIYHGAGERVSRPAMQVRRPREAENESRHACRVPRRCVGAWRGSAPGNRHLRGGKSPSGTFR